MTQRAWSWACLGIGHLLFFLFVRHLFIYSIIKRAKTLNSKWFNEIKKIYIKKCAGGWILFGISLMLFILFWRSADFQKPSLNELAMIFLIILTILLSVISHLIALGVATIHVLKQLENNQMTL